MCVVAVNLQHDMELKQSFPVACARATDRLYNARLHSRPESPWRAYAQATGHRRVPGQGAHHLALPGEGLRGRLEHRAHPRSAQQRGPDPGRGQEREVGAPRRERRQGLRTALRGPRREEEEGRRAQGAPEGRGRAPARHRRGPRGRGDLLAPAGAAETQGPLLPPRLPRDHPRGHPRGPRTHPPHRRAAGLRAGDAPHPRPALRLRSLAASLEEDRAEALRRPRAERGHPAGGGARARADPLPRSGRTGTSKGSSRPPSTRSSRPR